MDVILLGATGSIGTQTLDIVRNHKDKFNILAVTCNTNIRKLRDIIIEFEPQYVSIGKSEYLEELKADFPHTQFGYGKEGLIHSVGIHSSNPILVINALVGSAGLEPTIQAIKLGRNVALANKETLVVGGEIIMPLVKKHNVSLLPIDSEHSAIMQCINDASNKEVNRVIITASGGSFRNKSRNELKEVTIKDALSHPNWSMGSKITIDSATMMNKGFEVIEAHHLFDMPYSKIETILHKESIIHSMVEFNDSSIIAHLGTPDMRVPINYAMFYPKRMEYSGKSLDFKTIGSLNFEELSYEKYPLLKLAIETGKKGGLLPTVLNAANEECVYLFLDNKIGFLMIEEIVAECIKKFSTTEKVSLENILDLDKKVREYVIYKYR